ncbi:MAG: hypothetical protein ACOCN1_08970, partial [Bacteroidales bacterium]
FLKNKQKFPKLININGNSGRGNGIISIFATQFLMTVLELKQCFIKKSFIYEKDFSYRLPAAAWRRHDRLGANH